ncbi:MAG TPA: LysR family transcriptional regulator [Vicinamibacterales bacterium]|nr:LysR family transcriptional regulator [Vicinamibacterales bacterium]
MDLEIRHLRLVAEISDAGSMTRAAERLCLTQSALSHQLRDIEGRLGTTFFVRLGRRMVLTAAGRRVLETARRVIGDLEHAEEDVRRLAGNSDGSIRVCTQCNTGYHWLAPLLTVFQRKHPRVSVHVAADATAHPIDALVEGRVDLAILIDSVPDRRLRLRPLFTDEMVAVVARSHPLAKRRWISAQDLAREHLLLYSSRPEESFLLRKVLAPEGLTPARVSFIMLTEAMIELARAGTGVGILPRWSAQRAIASGGVAALSITRRAMRRRWVAATLAAQPDPPYLVDFMDLLAERAMPARTAVRPA